MTIPVTISGSVLDLVGNTPMVDVSRLSPNEHVRILAKLESHNPFGSVKDRVAKAMIEDAKRSGRLRDKMRIVEPSSGNTGIAVAAIGALYGHPVTIVVPDNVSRERLDVLAAYGADLVHTDGRDGSNGAIRRALELADEHPDWCLLYQYANEANPATHHATTGPEIYAQTGGTVTHFVAGLGTSGTLLGVGTYLKAQNPAVQIVAVEPPVGETLDGLRALDAGYVPPIFDAWDGASLLNRRRLVRTGDAVSWSRRLVRECSIFAGVSAGAAMCGAAKVAAEIDTGTVVFIVCDGGWKYLSTGAYSQDADKAVAALDTGSYF
jgi:[CysO sulfur-carrier protein]-thiocarboxylate-dependent cysteine synthase